MIKLVDQLSPMGSFPVAEAKDINFSDNESLQDKYDNGELGGGGTAEVPIEKIKVNGELQTPVNKVVDITVPDAYDDTALSNRVKTIEDDYAKSSDIPSLSGYATETWVNEQGFLKEHQDLTDYAKKNEIPDVSGYITEEQLLAKDYADKAYVTEEIAKASTGGEIDLSSYLSKVEATETYVAKESGKSLIADTEIERLASVDNYDDTQVKSDISSLSTRVKTVEDDYAKKTDIPSLDNYLKAEDVSAVATSGSYNDLTDKPEFETVNIDFTTEY